VQVQLARLLSVHDIDSNLCLPWIDRLFAVIVQTATTARNVCCFPLTVTVL
jgi:hypothetical protein